MKILLMTDMEGVAGILNAEDWVKPTGRYYENGKRLLTLEVNAAIEGIFSGGATEVLVVDGHGPGGINPELLDSRAFLMRGRAEQVWPWGLDSTFAGVGWIGQHAKAGTPYSHLTHTQSYHVIDMAINGFSIGEFGQLALCARELGVPSILACGEHALAEEAEALAPGIITAIVKWGLLPDGLEHLSREQYSQAKLSAIHMSPERARTVIREAAYAAMEALTYAQPPFSYVDIEPPFERNARIREQDGKPAYESRDKHPTSIIELMNIPFER